jgi:hypothetical protein
MEISGSILEEDFPNITFEYGFKFQINETTAITEKLNSKGIARL